MRFIQTLKKRKLLFLNIFLLLYIAFNLLDGERGLISYFEKKKLINDLKDQQVFLNNELKSYENKNKLLSDNLNFDFLDTLLRDKLKFGKKNEILIKLNE